MRILWFLLCFTQLSADIPSRKHLGRGAGGDQGYGSRSTFETEMRKLQGEEQFTARTRTPLQNSVGTITPSGLHFERHHAGIPDIDPKSHKLLIRGLVKKPLVFAIDDLKRLPSVTKTHFLECAGNSRSEWKSEITAKTVQDTHGMVSNSEWVGVPLRVLLEQVGLKPEAKWLIVEGADASGLNRSLPLSKCLDDVIVAYGQNGEALRPEQGYPIRLVVPGWEGNTWIKWLSQIYVTDQPYMTQQETSKYTDLQQDGRAKQFSFVMQVKSVITFPSGEQTLKKPGFYQISGLAWSGDGKITKVDVSTDGGKTWKQAVISQPVLDKAHVRFMADWWWDGKPCILQSRAYDEKGFVQPSRKELLKKGAQTDYHWNGIQSWKISSSGKVENYHEEA